LTNNAKPKCDKGGTILFIYNFNSLKMNYEFMGTLMLFSGATTPTNWLDCDGKVLPIAQNQALYSLLGNRYGGSYPTTFALPKMPKVGDARYIICSAGRFPSPS
jgi:hypothetical protein